VEVGRQLLNVERDIGRVGRVRVARFRVGRYSHLSPPPLARFSSVITISVKAPKTASRASRCNLDRSRCGEAAAWSADARLSGAAGRRARVGDQGRARSRSRSKVIRSSSFALNGLTTGCSSTRIVDRRRDGGGCDVLDPLQGAGHTDHLELVDVHDLRDLAREPQPAEPGQPSR
jgi:hypothetical protein